VLSILTLRRLQLSLFIVKVTRSASLLYNSRPAYGNVLIRIISQEANFILRNNWVSELFQQAFLILSPIDFEIKQYIILNDSHILLKNHMGVKFSYAKAEV